MKLLPNWRLAWRWSSVQLSALGAVLLALAIALPDVVTSIWSALPPAVLDRLPANVALLVPLAIQIAAGVARVIQQGSPDDGR